MEQNMSSVLIVDSFDKYCYKVKYSLINIQKESSFKGRVRQIFIQ